MRKKIKELLTDYQRAHSEFQINNFIVGAAGDDWAQYKQALREIASRFDQIEDYPLQIELAEIELKEIKARRAWFSKTKKARREIEIVRAERRIEASKRKEKETRRELAEFVARAVELKAAIGELTDEKRRELEARSWEDKARKLAALDLISGGGISRTTSEFIFSLPAESRRRLIDTISTNDKRQILIESLKQ